MILIIITTALFRLYIKHLKQLIDGSYYSKLSLNCSPSFSLFLYINNILAIISNGISFEKNHWQRGDLNLRRRLSVNRLAIQYTIMLPHKRKHLVQR